MVNSRFLERPQKRNRRSQLTCIHRRLPKTIDSGQDPEKQAGIQSDGYGGVETGMEVWGRRWILIGFAEEKCFQFGVKELWGDGIRVHGLKHIKAFNCELTHR